MESLNFFDLLAQETAELGKVVVNRNPFINEDYKATTEELSSVKNSTTLCKQESIKKDLELGAGIIYRIDKGANTFCLRGVASSHIENSLTPEELAKNKTLFRIQNEAEFDEVFYFKTQSLAQAEVVLDALVNRRIPFQEDVLCNLSDPGLSWWMDVSKDRLQVYFKSYGVDRAEKLIRLGPIGDPQVAHLRFRDLRPFLQQLFPITEWVCSEKMISVATGKTCQAFNDLRDLFWQGKNPQFLAPLMTSSTGRTSALYFTEVALVRQFWMEIQKRLKLAGAY